MRLADMKHVWHDRLKFQQSQPFHMLEHIISL